MHYDYDYDNDKKQDTKLVFQIAFKMHEFVVLKYTLKWSQLISFCWQPEMSGWIQAAMQQNTISKLLRFKLHL